MPTASRGLCKRRYGKYDELAERRLRDAGAEPAFKGYHGYPATICASVRDKNFLPFRAAQSERLGPDPGG
jgi:hypothetical protein